MLLRIEAAHLCLLRDITLGLLSRQVKLLTRKLWLLLLLNLARVDALEQLLHLMRIHALVHHLLGLLLVLALVHGHLVLRLILARLPTLHKLRLLLEVPVHLHKHLPRNLVIALELLLLLVGLNHAVEVVLALKHLILHAHVLHLLTSQPRIVWPTHHFTETILPRTHLVHQILSLALELELLSHIGMHRHVRVAHASRVHCKVGTRNLRVVLVHVLLDHMQRFKFESLSFLWLHAGNLGDVVVLDVLIADLLEDFPRELTD